MHSNLVWHIFKSPLRQKHPKYEIETSHYQRMDLESDIVQIYIIDNNFGFKYR
jgi:hypothetical protein